MTKLKKKPPLIFLIIIILIGLVISLLGIYFVTQHKKTLEINLKKNLTNLVLEAQHTIKDRVLQNIEERLNPLINLNFSDQFDINELKSKVKIEAKFIKYPFLFDSGHKIIFPQKKQAILPLQEYPHEYQNYNNIIENNRYLSQEEKRESSLPIFSNIQAQNLYHQGIDSEFNKGDLKQAYKYYKKGNFWNKTGKANVIFFNGMARCFFKRGLYKNALSIYLMINERFSHFLVGKLEFLKFRIYRQIAFLSHTMGNQSNALKFYLSLYKIIVNQKDAKKKEIFVLYKNEALDYLSHLNWSLFPKVKRDEFSALKEKDLKISVSRLESQIKEVFSGVKMGLKNRGELIQNKLEDIFLQYQREICFYQSLKTMINWNENKTSNLEVVEPKADCLGDNSCLYYKKIHFNQDGKEQVFFFGFLFDQKGFNKELIVRGINADLVQQGIKIQFIGDSIDPGFSHQLVSIPFKEIFLSRSLGLFSSNADYISKKVRQETWINYTLIGILIITFTFFIILFYKYISREAELLKLKSDFVDSVSHTLKTPLTRISLLAENVFNNWVKSEKQKNEFLQTIMSESSKMNEMINNMLNFSKIDAGKKQYDFKKDNIGEIVKSVVDHYTEYIRRLGFDLKFNAGLNIMDFQMDREAIKLMVINLLQNAIKYSPDEKYIRIEIFQKENKIILEVEDHGLGIPKKEQKKIFEKYYRTPIKRIRALEGSGLGLYLIKDAVQAHGGEIRVKSELGKGSTFMVIFFWGKEVE